MRDMLTPTQFANEPVTGAALVRAGASVRATPGDGRTIEYIFSDGSIALDGHRILTSGWDLDSYNANPVFCFAHDTAAPPVGRTISTRTVGDQLLGTVEYADADTYPFADTIFRLTKGDFLNACSVSWEPLEWKLASGKGRAPGAIDFIRQSLLECSAVPVPALQTALVTARGAGIDIAPVIEWAERTLDTGGMALVPRTELETLRRTAGAPTMTQVITPPEQPAWAPQLAHSIVNVIDPELTPAEFFCAVAARMSSLTAADIVDAATFIDGASDDAARGVLTSSLGRKFATRELPAPLVRKGKVMSADNEKAGRTIMQRSVDHANAGSAIASDMGEWINSMCGDGEGPDETDGDLDDASFENAASDTAQRMRHALAAAARHRAEAE